MLTRFVRNQLIIFTIASIVGVAVMLFAYMQVPTLLNVGRLTVTLELPAAGGLYRFGNVTYRGVQIGKVKIVALTENGAEAVLSLNTSPKIPADLEANVLSVSAVGEQYVDLRPRTDSGPYLQDGSRIPVSNTTIPQQVGPMLDQVSKLVNSIPGDRISDLLDETFKAFNGAGPDFGSLIDSGAKLSEQLNSVSDESRGLIDDSGPLLDSQAETADSIRTWARSLEGITAQLVQNDPQIRTLLERGPGFAQEVSGLLNQIKPTLPVLLANLTTLGQILVTYNPSLEQLLVPSPRAVRSAGLRPRQEQSHRPGHQRLRADHLAIRCRARSASCRRRNGVHPPTPPSSTRQMTCTASCRRIPRSGCAAPVTTHAWDTRASAPRPSSCATTQRASSRRPCVRTLRRGPYPFDPNIIAQGFPVDDRIDFQERIFRTAGGHTPAAGRRAVGDTARYARIRFSPRSRLPRPRRHLPPPPPAPLPPPRAACGEFAERRAHRTGANRRLR